MSLLPSVSLAALERGDASEESVFIEALEKRGMFYLTDVGISVEEWTDLIATTRDGMSEAPKPEGFPLRGYAPLATESTEAVITGNAAAKGDYCAKFTMGDERVKENVWPPARPDFKDKWQAYEGKVVAVAKRVLVCMGAALGIDTKPVQDGEHLLRFLDYPDVPADRCGGVRMAAHHDIDTITLLHQTPCPNGFVSLQALLDGDWVGVPAKEATLVCNFGEVLSIITGGRVKATKHRVAAPPLALAEGSSRTTTVLFFQPNADFPVKPLPNTDFAIAEHADHQLTYGEWLLSAIKNFQKQAADDAAAEGP